MLPYSTRLSRIGIGLFFLLAIGYGFFEAQGILLGPTIDVPSAPMVVHQEFIRIQGTATHIASLSMNGAEIPVTEAGAFDEPFLLAKGENRIALDAKDKYGNVTHKVLTVVFAPTSTPPTTPPATSTDPHGEN